tara:strand:+ start:200 stop:400 length:201 start_codon:yes stop_codon:yes gene_type:complete
MKKKQTYIIGEDTPKKKINKPKQNKKPVKKNRPSQNYESKSSTPINTAFAEAFAKLGVSSKDFQKK